MQLEVESTSVADGLALIIPPPQSGGDGVTVGTAEARAPIVGQLLVGLDGRPVHAVHLIVNGGRLIRTVCCHSGLVT